jgi:Peptidase family M23
MLSKRLYTFIVASHADARIWRFSVPYPLLVAFAAFAVIGIIAAGVASYHYGRTLLKLADYNRILAENDSFRSENHNYRIQTAQLGEKIDFLETTSRKLEILSGMESPHGVGGVGGFSASSFSQPLPASAGTLQSIDTYNRQVEILEDRYRSIESDLSYASLVDSAFPAFWPVRGYITCGLGRRSDPFNEEGTDFHTGVDISAPYGKQVLAPADGTVIFAGYRAGYGNIVVIDHRFDVTTRYGHLSRFTVQVGQRISRSDVIGYVGTSGRSTGPHLHFEVRVHNQPKNPKYFIRSTDGG